MKAVVAAFNQEKALVGAFSLITNHRMELFEALAVLVQGTRTPPEIVTTDQTMAGTRRLARRGSTGRTQTRPARRNIAATAPPSPPTR